jgi:outer membrane protein
MKKIALLFIAVAFITMTAQAQRVAYVDINTILSGMPEYENAQRTLDQTAEKWKQEISQEYAQIEEMYRRYQAEQVLLSDKSRQQREDEIVEKEKQVRGMQQKRFGPEGQLFKKRQELVKPIQDKVYNAIQEYATDKNLDLIFDKSSGANILFANPQLDKTEDILEKLGVKKDKEKEDK